jgi:WD40 repeat protein
LLRIPPTKVGSEDRAVGYSQRRTGGLGGPVGKEPDNGAMPGVQNHFDHLTPDLKGNRLFIVPEDNKSIEVYDIRSGEFIHSIKGIGVGHSVVYRADIDEIFVTDGSEGALHIFNGTTYQPLKTVKLLTDADATGYDPVSRRYVPVQLGVRLFRNASMPSRKSRLM